MQIAADCDESVSLKLSRNNWSSKALLCLTLNFVRLVLFKEPLALFLKMFFDTCLLDEEWEFKARVVVTLLKLFPTTTRARFVSSNLHIVSRTIKIA